MASTAPAQHQRIEAVITPYSVHLAQNIDVRYRLPSLIYSISDSCIAPHCVVQVMGVS